MKYRAIVMARKRNSLGVYERHNVTFIDGPTVSESGLRNLAILAAASRGLEVQNVESVRAAPDNGDKTIGDLVEEFLDTMERVCISVLDDPVTVIKCEIRKDRYYILAVKGTPHVHYSRDELIFNNSAGQFYYGYGDEAMSCMKAHLPDVPADYRPWFTASLHDLVEPILCGTQALDPELDRLYANMAATEHGATEEFFAAVAAKDEYEERKRRQAAMDATAAYKWNASAFRNERSPGWEWSVNCVGGKLYAFRTEGEAEHFINDLREYDRAGVEAGDYSLDGPNEEGTEFPRWAVYIGGYYQGHLSAANHQKAVTEARRQFSHKLWPGRSLVVAEVTG